MCPSEFPSSEMHYIYKCLSHQESSRYKEHMFGVRLRFKSSPSPTHTEHLLLASHCSKHLTRII